MPKAPLPPIATLGIDIGKNSFRLTGLDERGTIVLRQKLSRVQVEQRLANIPTCLIVMGAYVHSRLREMVLGGTTQSLIRNATVPLFLSY